MPKDPSIKKVLVIGSGPIIIGQAAEFDYSGTQACRALKSEGIEVVLVNSNPATIMTDPDIADRVYVEPMTLTVLKRIIEKEKPDSILPNLGGQTGLNLAMELARSGYLEQAGVRLLGAKPDTIDRAEDRQLFKDTMEKLGEPVIPSKVVESLSDALAFAGEIGYPVIVRPAFTMGGTGGGICETVEELHEIGTNGLRLSPIHHLRAQGFLGVYEFVERPFRELDHTVIQRGLEAGAGLPCDVVGDLVQRIADSDLRGHLGDGIARSLAGQRRGTGHAGIHLDDAVFKAVRV